ncbi:hypothetical protein CKO44_14070 [Rubrivivax gelatinosus]|uniref:Uncharacterized protein n=1 Tax=Rubrivivax gelatinosus TaxID=28068 RepID=A0ABS1DYK5_RUBGE|nr:hypothetical protein [Rubrivivax gelatinosus]MBK1614596.1 hypothetical protein [Rubrivivax gelatinosus]MBK1714824.1 hypothetical protein [Rubrivivax gelatinosus]
MAAVKRGLAYRLGWSAFAVALAAYSVYLGLNGGGWSHVATALAWVLFAVSWFLQPVAPSGDAPVAGAAGLRNGVTIAAVVLLVGSLVVRWLFGV